MACSSAGRCTTTSPTTTPRSGCTSPPACEGRADRIGRLFPALVLGIPVVILGSFVSADLYGESDVVGGLIGVSSALLFAGLGFASLISARFPYPVPQPGDSPSSSRSRRQPRGRRAVDRLPAALIPAAPAISSPGSASSPTRAGSSPRSCPVYRSASSLWSSEWPSGPGSTTAADPSSSAPRRAADGRRRGPEAAAEPTGAIVVARRLSGMWDQRAAADAGGGTDTLDRELEELIEKEQLEDGDHDRFSHYVQKEKILESAVTGKPVSALRQEVGAGPRPGEVPGLPHLQGDLRIDERVAGRPVSAGLVRYDGRPSGCTGSPRAKAERLGRQLRDAPPRGARARPTRPRRRGTAGRSAPPSDRAARAARARPASGVRAVDRSGIDSDAAPPSPTPSPTAAERRACGRRRRPCPPSVLATASHAPSASWRATSL